MKRKSTFPALVILILILGAVFVTTSPLAAILPEHGPSASGAGLFSFRNNLGKTERWSFSFEAIANKNGQTRGRAQFDNLTAQTHVVVRINCLSVTSELNTAFAVIGGTVLHSDDPDLPRLQNVLFAASDGPLPPVSTSDTITPLFPFPFAEQDCHDTQPLTILPVEDGDIKIQLSGQTG
jgi:hypothetical protein